jgi:GNAT superfamily N-acetyltransferase
MPSGALKNAWRAHRLVILPEYQGLGIGARLTDALGDIHITEGKRFYLKTTHPRLGEYCNRSDKWRGTSKNGIARPDYNTSDTTFGGFADGLQKHMNRVCYSHEYIGLAPKA